MPVTARLSKRFYEVLGEDVARELVDWFNQVDATYRSDLRDINDRNFALFDAKVSEHVVRLNARIDQLGAELHAKIERVAAELKAEFHRELRAQTRWLIIGWATLTATSLGIWGTIVWALSGPFPR